MFRLALTSVAAVSAMSGALAAPVESTVVAAGNCTRATLKANTETYMAAQAAGKPQTLLALSGGSNSSAVTYTEDSLTKDLTKGVLTMPLKIDHNSSLLDTTQCATYTELIVTDPKNPRVIGTQLRFDPATGHLWKVESLVTQKGDWAFNASGTLRYAKAEDGKWATIPEKDRDSRATIQAAADAYMDLFNNKSVVVPWGTPCDRLEGSMYTGNFSATDSCNVGVPSGIHITNRRYVIDETVGAVDALVKFQTRPDSHEFRVEKGKLRYVHTLTIMRNLSTEKRSVSAPAAAATRTRRSLKLW